VERGHARAPLRPFHALHRQGAGDVDPADAVGKAVAAAVRGVHLGRIPRGRARTKLIPQPSVPAAELLALLDQSEQVVAAAQGLDRNTWITHPVFGPLRRDDALKFLRIHNRHHLRIVSDIINAQKGR
jgi:hypothetical protein